MRYRTQLVNGLFAEAQEAALAFAQSGQPYAAFVQKTLARHKDACSQGPCRVLVRKADMAVLEGAVQAALQMCIRDRMYPAGCPGLLGETGNGCILHGYFVPCTNTKLS